jgi:hypothetical protein
MEFSVKAHCTQGQLLSGLPWGAISVIARESLESQTFLTVLADEISFLRH